MEIKELPDYKFNWNIAFSDNNLDLLEYVVKVANKFHSSFDGEDFGPSEDPIVFNNRYIESKLDLKEKYERLRSFGYLQDYSFESYYKGQEKSIILDASFIEKFLDLQLQNTISAYGLDASKLWYLILYVNDFVKDLGINTWDAGKFLLDELNELNEKLTTTTEIILKKDGRKHFSSERKQTIEILSIAMKHFINDYNCIIESNSEDSEEKLKQLGLSGVILNISPPLSFRSVVNIDISYLQYKFAEMLLYFLKDKKGVNPPNVKEKVYKEKHFFVSMLLYVVGLYDEDEETAKKKWYEPYYNDKDNRNLSNLVRNYKNRKFPNTIHKIYKK